MLMLVPNIYNMHLMSRGKPKTKTGIFSRFCFFTAICGQNGDIMLKHNIAMYYLYMSLQMFYLEYVEYVEYQ